MGIGAVGDTSGSAAFHAVGAHGAANARRAAEANAAPIRDEGDQVQIGGGPMGEGMTIRSLAEASRANEVRPQVVEAARRRLAAGHADDPQVIEETVRRMLGEA